ncbi:MULTISPECIES: twin transmembrane helix small protein [Ruegeria]|jgi:hypothetical protein|uniref:twin transmembrane helix small protein n=1 Tax=Ruegeria TaxID=97050 RepID=UPI00147D3940
MDPLMVVLLLAMAAVVVVLTLGIANFGKSGMDAAKKSNKMMRLRILFQFIAVLLIVLYVFLRGQGV